MNSLLIDLTTLPSFGNLRRKGDYESAGKKALEIVGNDGRFLAAQAIYHAYRGNKDEAEDLLKAAGKEGLAPMMRTFVQSEMLYVQQKFEEAIEMLTPLIRESVKLFFGRHLALRTLCYIQVKNFTGAIEDTRTLLAVFSTKEYLQLRDLVFAR